MDAASIAFFAAHPELSAANQQSVVSSFADAQRRSPYRPLVHAAAGSAATGLDGTPARRPKVRAYIDGCYDIMHSGHYNAIRQAKSLCDELVVGIHSNAEILRQKGPPVMSDEERLATVRACKWVDEVVFDTPYCPSVALLDSLNCDFCVHGDDDALAADGTDAFAELKAAGRMAIVKRTEGVSTTDLVNRLLQLTKNLSAANTSNAAAQAAPAASAAAAESIPLSATAQPIASSALPVPSVPSAGSPPPPAASSSSFLPTTWRISQFANHRVPRAGDTVVYLAGSFDLFHAGHIEKLAAAKALGSFLYVGLYDDSVVSSYKGAAPVMNLHERALNVLQCKWVDEVVIGAPWSVTGDLVKTLGVHVVARALPKQPAGSAAAAPLRRMPDPVAPVLNRGIVREIHPPSDLHTSAVIARILENRALYEARNKSRQHKEEAYAKKKESTGYVEEK